MAPSGRERAQIQLDYKRLHRAADSRVPKLKTIIANALNAAYNSVTDLEAADAYSHSPESFRRAIDWRAVGTILGAPQSDYTIYKAATAADVFGEVFIDGAETASASLSGSLAMTEPLAIAYGQQRAGTLIQGIQTQQLNTVRSAIGAGLAEGIPPQRTGRLLRVTTGLSERQGASLVNYERGLTEKMLTGTTGTVLRGVGRPLADQRYSLANLNQQKIDNLVERYRERLVNYRAEMIARTETMRAANMGAFAEQRAQGSAGLFDAKTAQRVWQTTPDDRACSDCNDLDGQTVGFEQSFVLDADASSNTTGENMSGEVPPLHPMCRCTFYLDVSLESLSNAFRDGNFDFGTDTRTLDDLLGPHWQEGFKPGAQMPLPSLPQLNYLPPSIPSARGGAAAEETVTAPRARRPRTPKPRPPEITGAETAAAEAAATEAAAAEALAAETAAAEAAAARGAEAAAQAASAMETAAAETEAAAQSAIQTNGAKYIRGQSRDTYETFDFLTESKPIEYARPDVLRWENMKDAERVAYDIAERQGFANLPEVGNAARLAEEIEAGGKELFSGQTTADRVEEFKTGQFRSLDRAGNRTNTFSPDYITAQDAASQGKAGADTRIVNAVLRADAKTITSEDAWALFGEVERGGDLLVLADDFEQLTSYLQNVRMEEWISAQGYDAIYTKGLGVYDESYTILNRTSVIVRDSARIEGSALKAIGEVPVITEVGKGWELAELVEFVDSTSEQTLAKVLEEMSKIHNLGREIPRDAITGILQRTTVQSVNELMSGIGGEAGGNFTPGWGNAPHININTKSAYVQNTFMHEMGHRVDALYLDGSFNSFFTEGGSPEAIDFLRAATKESGSYLNNVDALRRTQSIDFVQYFEQGIEVWARAYEQWMAYELEPVIPELAQAIRYGNATGQRMQWDEEEFRKYIGPKVREVLRSRGLLASA